MTDNLMRWTPPNTNLIKGINTPDKITAVAQQLSKREIRQVAQNFESENFEIATNFIWLKAMASLKKELETLGTKFLGEMLGKPDIDDDDDINDVVTDREAVRLAKELGIVSSTEGMRLKNAYDIVNHFSKLDASEIDSECIEMNSEEAMQVLKACVNNILAKPKVEVAKRFIDFRDALEAETFRQDDERVGMLLSSPYFFYKLTLSVLLAAATKKTSAQLENALANLNTLLPKMWESLRDTEKWQVGQIYAEVYSAGKSTATSGIKKALLKVQGFDFVPENLRSDTFIKAAEKLIKSHEALNNFYNEEGPMRTLLKMGSTIPTPALSLCTSAILAVRLGNPYGISRSAAPIAQQMLTKYTPERWEYYLNQCLPGDVRILGKLSYDNPRDEWFEVVGKYKLSELSINTGAIKRLLKASAERDHEKVEKTQRNILNAYYGR